MFILVLFFISFNALAHEVDLFIDNNASSKEHANLGATYSNRNYFTEDSDFNLSYFTHLSPSKYSTTMPSFRKWVSATSYSYAEVGVSYTINPEKNYAYDGYSLSYKLESSSVTVSFGGALFFLESSAVLFELGLTDSYSKYLDYRRINEDNTISYLGNTKSKSQELEIEISNYFLDKTFIYDTEIFWALSLQKSLSGSDTRSHTIEFMLQSIIPLQEYYVNNFFKSKYLFNNNIEQQFFVGSTTGRGSFGRGIYEFYGDFGFLNMLKVGYKKSGFAAAKSIDVYTFFDFAYLRESRNIDRSISACSTGIGGIIEFSKMFSMSFDIAFPIYDPSDKLGYNPAANFGLTVNI